MQLTLRRGDKICCRALTTLKGQQGHGEIRQHPRRDRTHPSGEDQEAGTGGTLKGVARVLKEKRPGTRVMVCVPANSQLLGSGIPQAFANDGSFDGNHPSFRPHLMQGWSPDFIPKLTQDSLWTSIPTKSVTELAWLTSGICC